eukprot:3989945-Alexandrium_andersonii.AAC.1
MDQGSARDGHRVLALEALERCYALVKTAGMFLSRGQCSELIGACCEFCQHYNALTHLAAGRGQELYNV